MKNVAVRISYTTLELKDSIRETRTLCATAEPTARLTSKCRTRKNQVILTGSSITATFFMLIQI
ncbi:MAG: hypothetical protein J6Z82_03305, partial [Schwartzia sp.]|nr:hypothetical protein [Schwartzia sp. (in: firmicutes)]